MAGSLASATNTRVDSASKHIIPCKVNTDYMVSLVGSNVDNSMRKLQTNKMKYCMHKDDIVIGLGLPMFGSSINNSRKKAYPSVIVTLAGMDDLARKWIDVHNFLVQGYDDSETYKETYFRILNAASGAGGLGRTEGDVKRVREQVVNMLGKTNVAMIKPYIVSKYPDPDYKTRVQHFPMDKCRIFGKAISYAQRFEMLDIMLSRQAI